MIAYRDEKLDCHEPRAHPWSTGRSDPSHSYVDFKAEPSAIRVALEDWVPFSHEPFAESFFRLLEWLNGNLSHLESNDSAFRPAHENRDKQFKFAKRCDGRLMIFFRDLFANTQTGAVHWLLKETMGTLSVIDQQFAGAAVAFSLSRTAYMALGERPKEGALGWQLNLSFFAYGKNRGAAHRSMNRLIGNVDEALRRINARIARREHQVPSA